MLTDGFLGGSVVKYLPAHAGDEGFIRGLRRSPGGGNGKIPTPVFLPEKSHGQRSLKVYGVAKKNQT